MSKGATTKDQKDAIIRKRNLLELQRDYWRGKYLRFTDVYKRQSQTRVLMASVSVTCANSMLHLWGNAVPLSRILP